MSRARVRPEEEHSRYCSLQPPKLTVATYCRHVWHPGRELAKSYETSGESLSQNCNAVTWDNAIRGLSGSLAFMQVTESGLLPPTWYRV
jgi:hypothetical protein